MSDHRIETLEAQVEILLGQNAALFCAVKTLLAENSTSKTGFVLNLMLELARSELANDTVPETRLQGFDHLAQKLQEQAPG